MNEAKISDRAVRALAALVHEVRPSWDEPGIDAAIRKAATARWCRDDAHLIVAAVKCAAVVTNRTPAVIAHEGDHWRDPVREPERKVTVGRDVSTCNRCGQLVSEPEDEHTCARRSTPESRRAAIEKGRAEVVGA